MTELKTLLAQRDELNSRIEQLQREQKATVIKELNGLMREYGVTFEELQAGGTKPVKEKKPAKYRHPESGKTWSGLGKRPQWVHDALAAGKTLADFAIQAA